MISDYDTVIIDIDKEENAFTMEYILSLDIGTTTIKGFVYDQHGQIQGHSFQKVNSFSRKQ